MWPASLTNHTSHDLLPSCMEVGGPVIATKSMKHELLIRCCKNETGRKYSSVAFRLMRPFFWVIVTGSQFLK